MYISEQVATPLERAESNAANILRGKRLLLVAPQPFFANRGTPINVRAVVTALAREGVLIDLLAYPLGEDLQIPNVRIIRSPGLPGVDAISIGPSWKKIGLDILLALKALQIGIFHRYDVYHGIEEGAFVAGTLALIHGRPYIFDMDSYMADQLQTSGFLPRGVALSLFTKLENFFLRRAAVVLTVCRALTDAALAVAPHAQILQLEDFPLDSSTEVDAALAAKLRADYNLGGKKVFIYTGNLESYQGIDLMLDGYALALREAKEPTVLMLVGGSVRDIEKYKAKVKAQGIAESVLFVGERPGSEMGTFMSLADALVSPRLCGTNTPLKVFTYMATGKPILATGIASHTQVLSHEAAFLAEATPEAFGETFVKLMDGSDAGKNLASAKAREARRLIDQKYNRIHFESELIRAYSELVQKSFPT